MRIAARAASRRIAGTYLQVPAHNPPARRVLSFWAPAGIKLSTPFSAAAIIDRVEIAKEAP